MWTGFIILIVLILWESLTMSKRTQDFERRITELEQEISDLKERSKK